MFPQVQLDRMHPCTQPTQYLGLQRQRHNITYPTIFEGMQVIFVFTVTASNFVPSGNPAATEMLGLLQEFYSILDFS